MDPVIFIVLVVILIFVVFRLKSTFQRAKRFDRSEEIRNKLMELRKKKDEDNEKDEG
jgi:uncharacterized membrane protein